MKIYPHQLNKLLVGTDPLSQEISRMFLREDDPIKPCDSVLLTISHSHDNEEEGEKYYTVLIEREAYSPGPYPGTCCPYHESRQVNDVPQTVIADLCGMVAIIFSNKYKRPIRANLILEYDEGKCGR